MKVANLRDDTDTVGAVAGGLANLYYGMEAIPEDWLDAVQQKDLFDGMLVKFYQ